MWLFPVIYYDMRSGRDASRKSSDDQESKFRVRGRIWIEGEEGTFLGYGRVVLLERIKKYGSISKAASSMNMSYRHAWELVDSMNRQGKKRLVETTTGGKGGGGARLTETGKEAIKKFWDLYRRFMDFSERRTKKLNF
jgi:molybdate transport system regulatory protein